MLDGNPAPSPKRGHSSPHFSGIPLWPNGWMDQDATWYGGRPRPRPHSVRWGRSFPKKRCTAPSIFGPCLLWRNGWMDQDDTCHGGRPRPRPHCVRWGPSFPHGKRHSTPHFSAHIYYGQRSHSSATSELLSIIDLIREHCLQCFNTVGQHPAVKKSIDKLLAWLSVCSEMQMYLADATATPSSLASLKSGLV